MIRSWPMKKERTNKAKPLPETNYLKECFDYDPEDGELTWKSRPIQHFRDRTSFMKWNSKCAFKNAGCRPNGLDARGKKFYRQVKLDSRILLVHRICAAFIFGHIPEDMVVDHIDGDNWNNKKSNLRLATVSQNAINCRPHVDKKSSLPRGVYQMKGKTGYYTRISLGCYKTPEDASAALRKAAELFHGHFARFD